MQVLEALLLDEKVVHVLPTRTSNLQTDGLLQLLDTTIVVDEVAQEGQHGSLFRRLLGQSVDMLDDLLDQVGYVRVVDQKVTVLEDLCNKFPTVDSVLHIFHEQLNVLGHKLLVLLVVLHELDQEDVELFKDFKS